MPVRHQRPRMGQMKGWRKPDGAVMVTRPFRWGNPYRVDEHGREEAIRRYEADLIAGTLVTRPGHPPLGIEDARRELAGRDLVCACGPDEACHADVLIRHANP